MVDKVVVKGGLCQMSIAVLGQFCHYSVPVTMHKMLKKSRRTGRENEKLRKRASTFNYGPLLRFPMLVLSTGIRTACVSSRVLMDGYLKATN